MQHRQALPAGTRLHEYELLEVLGSGGFGIVYLAHDHELNQRVVIKEYLPSSCAVRASGNTVVAARPKDEDIFQWGLERFLAEARALAEFRQHPNIVSVLRYFKAHNTGYMVMEYAGAISLQDYLDQRGTLTEAQLHAMLFPLLDALEKVHEKGIIHRDLKPANILINAEGQPVLIDFGSARQAFGHKSMNMTAIISPGYSPFEQYTETGKQGPWTDIYALAAVMYRCITGTIPPDSLDRLEANTPLNTEAKAQGHYSPQLLTGIDWGLQVRIAERPASIDAWRQRLTQAVKAEPVLVLPVAATTKLVQPASWTAKWSAKVKQDKRLLFAPVLALALIAGVGLLLVQWGKSAPVTPSSNTITPSSTETTVSSVPTTATVAAKTAVEPSPAQPTPPVPTAPAITQVESTATPSPPAVKADTGKNDSAQALQQVVIEKQQGQLKELYLTAQGLQQSKAAFEQAQKNLATVQQLIDDSKAAANMSTAKRKEFMQEAKDAEKRNQTVITEYQDQMQHYRKAIGDLCQYGDMSLTTVAKGMKKLPSAAVGMIEKHRQHICAAKELSDKELTTDFAKLN